MKPPVTGKSCRWQLEDYVRVVAFRPGGAGLCVAALGNGRLAWLVPEEKPAGVLAARQVVEAHAGGVLAAVWSPDGRHLATGGEDGRICWWDSEGRLVASAGMGRTWVEHLSWSPDGKWLASAAGRSVRFWSPGGSPGRVLPDLPGAAGAMARSSVEARWAVVGKGGVRLVSGDSDDCETLAWPGAMLSAAWSPDGRHLAVGTLEKDVLYWSPVRPGVEPLRMSGYEGKVQVLAWDAGSRWLATGGGSLVTVWDVSGRGPEGTRPLQLDGHDARVTALAFGPRRDALASGSEEGSVCLWRVGAGNEGVPAGRFRSAVTALAWAPEGGMLGLGSAEGDVVVLR